LCCGAACADLLVFEKVTGAAAKTGAADAVENSRLNTAMAATKKNLMNFIIKELITEITIKPVVKLIVIKFLQ
jgi:hypothetical protein